MCYFMWIGPANEVMKVEFPYAIERGVPFESEYEGMSYIDLFIRDPLYVLVDAAQAQEMLAKLKAAEGDLDKVHALKQANVAAMAKDAKAKMTAWYTERDALRAVMAKPAPIFLNPPEPTLRPVPLRKKGGEQ
jgi:hypothetical protein